MVVLHYQSDITAWPVAQLLWKILVRLSWALAHARRRRVSWRRSGPHLGPLALPITLLLSAMALPATGTVPVTPLRFDAAPTPCRSLALHAAVACLGMGWSKEPFTAFEKTTPKAITTTRLLPCPTQMMQ
jgi:hypothetical protein